MKTESYELIRWIFLKLLGFVYLAAFASLAFQILGLVGSQGILPARQLMQAAAQQLGPSGAFWLPTLAWLNTSDGFILSMAIIGTLAGLAVMIGAWPRASLIVAWVLYLSLTTIGGDFLRFQWDSLLLEAGFLAIFFAPRGIWPRLGKTAPVSRVMLWLLRFLLFRLVFSSGVVKLASGDPTWRDLSALHYHFETQPLPTWVGWYAHQIPASLQMWMVIAMFLIELPLTFLIFGRRSSRLAAFIGIVALQLGIALTGNYGYFNILTIALCVSLLDDRHLAWLIARLRLPFKAPPGSTPRAWWREYVALTVAVPIVLAGLTRLVGLFEGSFWAPTPLRQITQVLGAYSIVNSYGLFAVMTTVRDEIVLEGSDDAKNWAEYEFAWKPGDIHRAPSFVAPHQPRLDWQMWFAALGTAEENPWFTHLALRLLQGDATVARLLEKNPFGSKPPRFIRALLYEYHFTDFAERSKTGAWWTRELKGLYLPAISLDTAPAK